MVPQRVLTTIGKKLFTVLRNENCQHEQHVAIGRFLDEISRWTIWEVCLELKVMVYKLETEGFHSQATNIIIYMMKKITV